MATGFEFSAAQSAKRVASSMPITYDPTATPAATPDTFYTKTEVDALLAEVSSTPPGVRYPWVNVSADYSMLAGDVNVLITMPVYADLTVRLPVSPETGQEAFVKRDATASSGTCAVRGAGPHTIEGGSLELAAEKDGVLLRYGGAGVWWIVAAT